MINSFSGEYAFLSNFYDLGMPWIKIPYVDEAFSNSEAAYQASKSAYPDIRKQFVNLSAREAKKLGKKIVLQSKWHIIKNDVMFNILLQKFDIPELKQKLIATGNQELVEGNWWGDTYWGMCNGEGENHLGKMLMRIRDIHTSAWWF